MKKILVILLATISTYKTYAQPFVPSIDFSNAVINSFSQGSEVVNKQAIDLNCASVAIVKCAIATFGMADVVKIDQKIKYCIVTLRNKDTLTVTDEDILTAKAESGFQPLAQGDTNIYNKAILLYTILAKRAPLFSKDADTTFRDCTSFNASLIVLRYGINADNLPKLLGLAQLPVKQNSQISWVYGNGFHAVFASYDIFDDDGVRRKINLINWARHISLKPKKIAGDFEKTSFILADINPAAK